MIGFLTSLGSFFRLRWKAILVIVAGIGIALLVWQWRSDIVQRVKAINSYEQVIQSLEEQQKAFDKLVEENKRVRRLNKKYREDIKEIKKSRMELLYEMEKLQESNKKVRNWANNRIPNAVLIRLRSNSTKSSYQNRNQTNSSSKKMDASNSTSKNEG